MISIYTGIPGSGKTYHAVKMILLYMSKGRKVYTNIRGIKAELIAKNIDWPVAEHLLYIIPDENLKTCYLYLQDNSLLVLDEYQNIWPVTEYASNTGAVRFFTTHRHTGIDVIFVTQSVTLGEKRLTTLCEEYHDFRKLSHVGLSSSYRHSVFMGATDDAKAHLYSKVHKYDKKIFELYSSYVSDNITESGKRNTIFSNPKVIGLILLFILLLGVFVYFAFKFLGKGGAEKIEQIKNPHIEKTSETPIATISDSLSCGRAYIVDWGDTTFLDSAQHVQKPKGDLP